MHTKVFSHQNDKKKMNPFPPIPPILTPLFVTLNSKHAQKRKKNLPKKGLEKEEKEAKRRKKKEKIC